MLYHFSSVGSLHITVVVRLVIRRCTWHDCRSVRAASRLPSFLNIHCACTGCSGPLRRHVTQLTPGVVGDRANSIAACFCCTSTRTGSLDRSNTRRQEALAPLMLIHIYSTNQFLSRNIHYYFVRRQLKAFLFIQLYRHNVSSALHILWLCAIYTYYLFTHVLIHLQTFLHFNAK